VEDLSSVEDDEVIGNDSDCTVSNCTGISDVYSAEERRVLQRQQPMSSDSTMWEDDYQRSRRRTAAARRPNEDMGVQGELHERIRRGREDVARENTPRVGNVRDHQSERLNTTTPAFPAQSTSIHVGGAVSTYYVQPSSLSSNS
jgi:hypothetical protein